MNIAMTGATGFVGRAMARELAGRGHHLICLVRPDPPAGQLPAEGVTLARGDILSPDALARAFAGCDAVVHLVGIIRERPGAPFEAVHVRGRGNVIEAAASGVCHIVHMSAVSGTMSRGTSRFPLTPDQRIMLGEGNIADPTTPSNPCFPASRRLLKGSTGFLCPERLNSRTPSLRTQGNGCLV